MKLRIGTRRSRLAILQTEIVKRLIEDKCPGVDIEVIPMSTRGDERLERSLSSFGGKGVFTRELEAALAGRQIDLAVHSAKDLPLEFPDGLSLGAVLRRGDPRDVVVTVDGTLLSRMARGSIVGTSSRRREIQVKQANPDVQVRMLRGNVHTRIQKLVDGGYDAIVLAAAGVERLGISAGARPCGRKESPGLMWVPGERIYLEYMDPTDFIPAAGQGFIVTEIRHGELEGIMAALHSDMDCRLLTAERKFLSVLGGGCNAPCGVYCEKSDRGTRIHAMYAADGEHPAYRHMAVVGQENGDDGELLVSTAEQLARGMVLKTVSLVGAGPGDPGLLTIKGLDCVRAADVIIYDNLVSPSILNEARLDAELIYAGKCSSHHSLEQEVIQALMEGKAREGKYVVRLKGGDPFVFGRGGEEALALRRAGIPFEVVSGVSSSYSVPAYAGIPVTERSHASSFHVVTGHEGDGKKKNVLDYQLLAREQGTLVFLMGLKNLPEITRQLMLHGMDGKTPAAAISRGTTAKQRKVSATLGELCQKVEESGIGTPAIVVVGQTAALGGTLSWFGKGSLSGKRILLTGTRSMSGKLMDEVVAAGGEAVALSLVEAVPCMSDAFSKAARQLEAYTWVVFTSANGVEFFFRHMRALAVDARGLMHLKFAVIGPGSQKALGAHGIYADFVPGVFSGAGLAREWVPTLREDDRVLLVRAKEASRDLDHALGAKGIRYTDAPAYEVWVDRRRKGELDRLVPDMDYITLSSGSAARALASLLDPGIDLTGKMVSIGPATTRACRELGIPVEMEAEYYTAKGVVQAIIEFGET